MTLSLPSPLRRALAAAALAFAAMLAVLALSRCDGSPVPRPVSQADAARSEIARLQAEVRTAPTVAGEAALASAYLQRARETGDPGWTTRADGLLRRALGRDSRSAPALVAAGQLAAARHDFVAALRYARRARASAPDSVAAYPVLVDALVELGRYGAAERALQAMVDAKPTLAAYARVSYLRELHGDLAGAAEAMRLAVSAGGGVRETVASVQALLGDVELAQGRPGSAGRAYAAALALVPAFPAGLAGEARLAAAVGDARLATRRWRALVAVRPLAEYAQALGEASWPLAAGARPSGRSTSSGSSRTCSRARGRTSTPSSRSSRPTTAARAGRCASRARPGRRRRACARRTRSAGRSRARAARRPASRGPAGPCGWGRSTRAGATTRA